MEKKKEIKRRLKRAAEHLEVICKTDTLQYIASEVRDGSYKITPRNQQDPYVGLTGGYWVNPYTRWIIWRGDWEFQRTLEHPVHVKVSQEVANAVFMLSLIASNNQ